ncbi:MAG: hypothetical protein H6553_03015 [Chitinophagales bacterium]|nr:hypothetical protein [Chitinophagales bacterium]
MKTITIELLNDNAIHLLQDLELLNIIKLPRKDVDIPDWHKPIIDERLEYLEQNPDDVTDFDDLLDEIERSL